jgi:ParB-like chromosome segregation protein Spo0J
MKNCSVNSKDNKSNSYQNSSIVEPEFKIDPDLKRLLPQPSEEEKKLLREQLIENGCLDPLLVWKEEKILVDGHNRYELCQELGIEFTTVEKSFPDRAAVELFIIENQLGRRNASSRQQSYYRGFYYFRKKDKHGGDRKGKSSSENRNLKKTREIVANRFGVASSTISEDCTFFKAVNLIDSDVGVSYRNQLIDSENLSKKLLQRLADLFKEENKKLSSQEERQELVKAILESQAKSDVSEKIIEFEKQSEFVLAQVGETLQEQGVDTSRENLFPTREKTQVKRKS